MGSEMCIRDSSNTYAQRSEEPPVLAALVALLEELLDRLLGVLTLRHLLEGLRRDNTLEALKLKRVTSREQVGVVDGLASVWQFCNERTLMNGLILLRLESFLELIDRVTLRG